MNKEIWSSKLQWNITSYPVRWWISKEKIITSVDKDVERLEPSYSLYPQGYKEVSHFGKQPGSYQQFHSYVYTQEK